MDAEMIFVGTELLLGSILNTNAQFLSRQCAMLGVNVYLQTVVGDNAGRLEEILSAALNRSDVVIMSGGLGPTEDDMTKETVARLLDRRLVEDPVTKNRLYRYFEGRPEGIPVNNWKQALVPEGSIVLTNENGTAPGIIVEKAGHVVIMLPGPPNELIPLFTQKVAPFLSARSGQHFYSETIKVAGLGESAVEMEILDLIDAQTNPTIATYAKVGEVHIRVTARGETRAEAESLVSPVREEICTRFGDKVYTLREEVQLEETILEFLKEKKLTLSCAESCTGGMLSSRLVSVPGASNIFKAGLVTYTEEMKHELLGVPEEIFSGPGVVSEECARAMAEGVRRRTGTNASVAVTGVAGPSGGTMENPVGTVWIAVSIGKRTNAEVFHFKGNRDKIRENAVMRAMDMLRRGILALS